MCLAERGVNKLKWICHRIVTIWRLTDAPSLCLIILRFNNGLLDIWIKPSRLILLFITNSFKQQLSSDNQEYDKLEHQRRSKAWRGRCK